MSSDGFKGYLPQHSNRQHFPHYCLLEAGIIILLLLATAIINSRMIRDGLNGNIDLIWHITWLQHFSHQLSEGIYYPRWLAGTNYGYGSPTFVFYPPLVYYIGSVFKFIGLNPEQAIVSLFSLALFLSGLNFYIFGRTRWGIIASLVGSLAYMTVPYLAFLIYWVGSVSSIFAIAWIPLGWWVTEKTLMQPKWGVGLAIFWAIMALTHLPSFVLCLAFWLSYILLFLFSKPWKVVLIAIVFAGIGLGIASFYLLPAFLERSLVNIDVMKEIGGGFQESMLGSASNSLIYLQFNSRPPHIFVHQSLVMILITVITIIFFRRDRRITKETLQWLTFAIVIAFFMSSWSWPIWQTVSILQSVQASWRLIFVFSFLGASLCAVLMKGILELKPPLKYLLSLVIIFILLINFKFGYDLSRRFPTFHNPGRANLEHLADVKTALEEPYTDKLKDVAEYIPLLSNGQPAPAPIIGQPRVSVIQGKAAVEIPSWTSYNRFLKVNTKEPSTIRIRTYFYPAWHLYVNQNYYPIDILEDGTISFKLSPGFYTVELNYQDTLAFIIGRLFSVVSILGIIFLGIIELKFNLCQKIID